MENNMVLVSTPQQAENQRKESGAKEKELIGLVEETQSN